MNLASLSNTYAHLPTDWIIFAVVFAVCAIDAMRSGASRAIAVSLAMPVLYACASLLPKTAVLDSVLKQVNGIPYAILLLVLLGFFSLCMYRTTRDYGSAVPVKALMAALATTIILIIFWIQIPALSGIWHFSSQVAGIFGTAYAFFWTIGSYLMLVAVRR